MCDKTQSGGTEPPATTESIASVDPVQSAHDSALSLATTTHSISGQDHESNELSTEDDFDAQSFDGNDSAFGGSLIGCDTDTLASYITDYRYENGRRYHAYKDGEYWVGTFFSGWSLFPDIDTTPRAPTMSRQAICKILHTICTL
jgi:hypothetical protein